MIITNARAIKMLNSRNEQTISIIMETKSGKVISSAPSGKSRGKHEAIPFSEKGIEFSISFANAISKKLAIDKISFSSFEDLEKLEKLIKQYDTTKNYSLIGGNTLFVLESAILKAMALNEKQELWEFLNPKAKNLPMPIGNAIGGGQHFKAEKKSDIQEFLFIPKTKMFIDSYFMNLQAYKEAKLEILKKDGNWRGQLTDEKAIASSLRIEQVLDIMREISEKLKAKFGSEMRIGMDIAASTLFHDENITIIIHNQKKIQRCSPNSS